MLRKSLATLPQTLDQTYDRILNTISEQDSVYAMHILQWLTFSARPLRVEEIAEIVAIDVTREPVFERNEVLVDPLEVLDICSSLVTITMEEAEAGWIPAERLIALAHSSVREYLVSDRIKQGPAKRYSMQEVECHKAITKDCLGYLNQFQQPVARKLFKTSALARYSAEFWVDHLRKSGDDMGEAKHLATSLLSTKSPAFLSWIRLYDPDHPWREPDLARGLESLATPLYYGARLGSSAITKLLLDQGADINALDGAYSNALHAASHEGHEAVARLLLDHGADANVHIKECGSALQVAAARGHKAIVQLLINAGADINSRDGYFGNALQAASAQGYEEIVSIILDAGAYVDMQGGSHGSALRAAIAGSHETTVELLLARGASAGLDDRMKGPVHHAVDMVQCKPALVSLLQQYGAPLDTVDFDNMTPLHYCVKRSHKVISTQLLEVGVPVDSRVHRKAWSGRVGILGLEDTAQHPGFLALGLTPLHFAALTGNIMMTKVLLEHGADPNAPSDHGESPLHLALRSRLLGPDYKDDWNDECLKAQRLAVMSRFQVDAVVQHITSKREEVLDALLAAPEIQLNVKDVDGESPLHCIQYGKAEGPALVQKLVSRGADMNWRNSRHQTPLHLASKAGDHESVKILLSMGAKVAMTDKTGLNALHYAAGSGDRKTVIAILGTEDSKAAKLITSTDKNRQNVLHHLLSERPGSRVEMVQWLLDQGVDGSGLDNLGMSPLATYIKHSKGEISINICRTFLEIEGNASFEDRHGRTLGHMCAMRFDFGIHLLQLLSEHDVNLKRKDDQEKTILHHAAECGHLTEETLEFLVEFIEADDKDKRGRTALQLVINKIAEAHDPNGWNSNRWDRTRDVLMNHHNHHDHHEPFSALYSNSGRISRKRRLIGTR
jgi:ankyrin repeat protein